MAGAKHPLHAGEGPLVQQDRLGRPAHRPVGQSQIAPGDQGGPVISAQQPFPVGEDPFKQRDRLRRPASSAAGVREARPGGQGIGVIGA